MFAVVLTNGKVWAVRSTIETARDAAQWFDERMHIANFTSDSFSALRVQRIVAF